MPRFFLSFLFIVSSVIVFSQEEFINGFVSDENGKPIPFANVLEVNSGANLACDVNGEFKLVDLPNISIIINQSKVPVIVDAGIGTASDATIAMELGCDGVLINSAIAKAKKPILMAKSFRDAVISGRNAYLAGRMIKNNFALASSPTKGLI